jgi:hypothetical protein
VTTGTQFLGFDLDQIVIVFLAMLLGGICKGIIGIALPLIGLTVMLLALEPKLAVAMMVIPIVLTNVQLAFATGLAGAGEALSRFWLMIATAMTSIFAVSLYAARIPSDVLLIALGFVVLAFVLLNVTRWKPVHSAAPGTARQPCCGKRGRAGRRGNVGLWAATHHVPHCHWRAQAQVGDKRRCGVRLVRNAADCRILHQRPDDTTSSQPCQRLLAFRLTSACGLACGCNAPCIRTPSGRC